MERRLREVALSGVAVFVAGYALWPPGNVYWNVVAERTGVLATIAIVMLLSGVVGAAVAFATGVSPSSVVIGGGVTYAVGTAAVERVVSPFDASEYAALYGLLLLCFVLGATAVTASHGLASATRRPVAR